MCICTDMQEALRADSDIYCYKLLDHYYSERNNTHLFVSPVMNCEFIPEVKMFAKCGEGGFVRKKFRGLSEDAWFDIMYGFHSYVSMEAINFDPQSCKRNGMVIAKCVIPCGAYYWKGVRSGSGEYKGGEYDEYCSDQIRFVAWTEPDKIEWRRPKEHEGDWPEPGKTRVSILNGLTIEDAARRLPYNFCHAYDLHAGFRNYLYHSPEYGYIELHTRYGVVVDGIA